MNNEKSMKNMPAWRSPLVKAWDDFFIKGKGNELCEGQTSGQFLYNRLVRAFVAGWDYCEKHHRKGGEK